jgi:hypothetical protein
MFPKFSKNNNQVAQIRTNSSQENNNNKLWGEGGFIPTI